jgi:hypothetical protein
VAAALRNKAAMMRRLRARSSPLAAPGRWPLALCGGPVLMVLLILPVLALLVPLAGAGGCELARWRRWMGRRLQ